jgi:outer membrane receptor protein involved in Fe transport
LGGFIDQEAPSTGQITKSNFNSSQSYVVRPALTWALSDNFTITPAVYYQHTHNDSPNSYWATELPNPGNPHAWGGIAQPMTDELTLPSLSIRYNFAGLSLVSDTSFLYRTSETVEDLTPLLNYAFGQAPYQGSLTSFAVPAQNNSWTQAWQEEIRLSSQETSSGFSWTVGAFFRKADQRLQQVITPDLTPLTEAAGLGTSLQVFGFPNYVYNGEQANGYGYFRATDVSTAGFANAAFSITSKVKLEAGLRVEHMVVRDQEQALAGPLNGLGAIPATYTAPDAVATPVTPRVSLTYQFTDNSMVYVSAAKGYRPGGGNNYSLNEQPLCQQSIKELGSPVPATYNPDSLWSYELGTKDVMFDSRLSLQASAYYIKWSDIQTSIGLPSCLNSFTGNRGSAISQGFDLQLTAAVTADFRLGGQVGYNHAYYPNASYGTPFQNPDGSFTTPVNNFAGAQIGGLVPWSAAVNAQYTHSIDGLWSGAHAYLRADYRWLDKTTPAQETVPPNPAAIQPDPAYSVLNVRLGITHGGVDLSAYVENLTRSDPRLGYVWLVPPHPLYLANAIRPLTTGVTLWYRF